MTDWLWIIGLCLIGMVALQIVHIWWRKRKAAKLADELLFNVVKGKDAFRR